MSTGHGGDEAVHQSPWRDALPPASPVDASGSVEVSCRVEGQEIEAQEEPTEGSFPLLVTRPRHDLHEHRLGDGQRAIVMDQLGKSLVDGAACRPVVFDPSRGVGEDHSAAGASSRGTSPMALTPRIAKASSRVMG